MQKQFIVLFLSIVLLFNLSYQKPHKCLQDKLNIEVGFTEKEENNEGGRMLAERENMRVTFDFSSLDKLTGDMIPLAQEVKRQTELSGQFFSNNLKVNRQRYNLKYPSSYMQCDDYTIPYYDKTIGIPNSDLHIYVNLFNDDKSDTLAYALPCILNIDDKRPVFGLFAVNLAYFKKEDVGKGDEFENNFETIAHELTHILGFSSSMYKYFINPSTGSAYGRSNEPIVTQTVRGIETRWITTPKVKKLAQEYYGCPTAIGMQLENQGGSGSAHSHWERTVLENDYMTASAVGHDAVFSRFTFALLEDSGWYTASYEYVDDIDWGKGQGCDFLYDCSPSKFREFNSERRTCNFYHSSVASNYGDRFADQCQISQVISNLYCSDPENKSNNDQYTGSTYALESRCFDSNILDKRVTTNSFSNHRCMEFNCNSDATEIEITVMGEKYTIEKKSNRVMVQPKGKNLYISGYVDGPEDWNGFCKTYPLPCTNHCSSQGYCMGKTCHCHKDRAGKDCSVSCSNDNYIHNGKCLYSQQCPAGTQVHKPTKECISTSGNTTTPTEPTKPTEPTEPTKPTEPTIPTEPTKPEPVVCASNEYLNYNNECERCPYRCTQCSSFGVCTACIDGYELKKISDDYIKCQEIPLVPQCKKGEYLSKYNECYPCSSSCGTCSDYSTCETCKEGYYMRSNNFCSRCYYGCSTCTEYTVCQSCKPGYKFVNYQTHRYCQRYCPSGFIERNGECFYE